MNRLATLLCALALIGTASSRAESVGIVPPGDAVDGRSQAQWSAAWWQWAGAFERDDSPVADRSGARCGLKQQGKVWFLAGTYGTQRTIRNCTVPRGKYLFFPLINYVVIRGVGSERSCSDIADQAAEMTDEASALVLELDGVQVNRLDAHRQSTPGCFDMGVRSEPKLRVFPSAANGYYVMLRPLAPGTHTLNFGGVLPSMVQAVTYTLTVE